MKNTNGRKYWQFAHGYPTMGLDAAVFTFGNYDVYGYALHLLPHLTFTVLKNKFGTIDLKHGTGLAWVTRPYDHVFNPENLIIGSHINAISTLQIGLNKPIDENMTFKIGLSLYHISNGMLVLPNAGVNTLSLYTNVIFSSKSAHDTFHVHPICKNYSKWRYRAGLALGGYEWNENTKQLLYNLQLNGLLFYQHNTRFRTGVGLEIGYLNHSEFKTQPAIYLEEEVQFSNITTRYGFGMYLAHLRFPGERFYSKIGMAYFTKRNMIIPEGFYIGTAMKAHNVKAAHVELSSGFLF